jgi:hypothetical protein
MGGAAPDHADLPAGHHSDRLPDYHGAPPMLMMSCSVSILRVIRLPLTYVPLWVPALHAARREMLVPATVIAAE